MKSALYLTTVLAAAASALPATETELQSKKCTKKLQRKAWHTLSKKEKKAYIDAELCLMRKPGKSGLPGATNRHEDLQKVHQMQAGMIHGVGAFFPFHRLFIHAHEKLLREECGYKGAQPYWDESKEAGQTSTSSILDPVTGFGGDGVGPDHCVADGPFAGYVNHIGPGYWTSEHCLKRIVNNTISIQSGKPYLDYCNSFDTYLGFWACAEQSPHTSGHGGIGGKMVDPATSPGDPIFYLHHTWVDKYWWDWQKKDKSTRTGPQGIGGTNRQPVPEGYTGDPDFPPFVLPIIPQPDHLPLYFPPVEQLPPPESLERPLVAQVPKGDPGNETTLNHVLEMYGIIPDATVKEVMDIGNNLLCVEYI